MEIEYTIVSIDESRSENKTNLRNVVKIPEANSIEFIDGRELKEFPYNVNYDATSGELGIWLSHLNCWKYLAESQLDALLVFEDDAIISEDFLDDLNTYINELPSDWDVLALFVPEHQRKFYGRRVMYYDRQTGLPIGPGKSKEAIKVDSFEYGSSFLAKAYQDYSCVTMLYSKIGAQKLLRYLNEYGIIRPVDCFIYLMAHLDKLNVFAPKPSSKQIVSHNWNLPSLRESISNRMEMMNE